jgi:hypothetical protein
MEIREEWETEKIYLRMETVVWSCRRSEFTENTLLCRKDRRHLQQAVSFTAKVRGYDEYY